MLKTSYASYLGLSLAVSAHSGGRHLLVD